LVDRLRRYFVGFAMVATVCFLWGAGQVAHPVQALACYGATCEDQGPVGTGCYRDQVIVAETWFDQAANEMWYSGHCLANWSGLDVPAGAPGGLYSNYIKSCCGGNYAHDTGDYSDNGIECSAGEGCWSAMVDGHFSTQVCGGDGLHPQDHCTGWV